MGRALKHAPPGLSTRRGEASWVARCVLRARAAENVIPRSAMALRVGDTAPDFDVEAHDGRRIALSEYRGKKNVVLYFYPKDFTTVCTKEACGFRDIYEDLQARDTEIVGVSFDDGSTHEAFAKEHRVPFPLVSDTNRSLAEAYGARSFFRDLLKVPSRVTFLIDKQGKIAGVFKAELSADTHVDGIRNAIAALG